MLKRFDYIDVMKAIAIIAVVLYHAGYMKFGYLGVDIFLVINGYLLASSFNRLTNFKGGVFPNKKITKIVAGNAHRHDSMPGMGRILDATI